METYRIKFHELHGCVFFGLVQRLELDVSWSLGIVDEGTRHSVKVMGADGNQRPLSRIERMHDEQDTLREPCIGLILFIYSGLVKIHPGRVG